MDFELDDDTKLLRDNVRQFCQQEIAPHAGAWDRAGALPPELTAKLGEVGLLGMRVDEAHGGSALSMVASVGLIEELAAASGSVALTVASHNFACLGHLLRRASPATLSDLLPVLTTGQALGGWALAEPDAGSDAAGGQMTATKDADGWRLSGRKAFVAQGSTAGPLVVVASVDPSARKDGLVAFVVDRNAPGISVTDRVETLGMCAADIADLQFDAVGVGDDQRLGEPGKAYGDVLEILDDTRIAVAAISCGIARAAMLAARDYAKERHQFGKPIASFQAIQWKLADMATNIDAAGLMTLKAAALRDAGRPAREAASRAKLFAATRASAICSDALQIHGGYGYTREFPIERFLRDARLCEIGEGTNEIQKIVVSQAIAQRVASAST